jgi:Co/Zn/Cd efflux system component
LTDCCAAKQCDLDRLALRQRRVLWFVLVVNAVMFFVEIGAGLIASSVALLGDSLDMLGDALAYASSLAVVGGTVFAKARSAQFKGWLMAALGCLAFGRAVWQVMEGAQPEHITMGVIGAVALAANVACLVALTRHRQDDVNMRSVWLCSRNDIIANTAVLGAAVAVAFTGSYWPDLVVGLLIMGLFLRSSLTVLGEARAVLINGTEAT